MTPPRYSARLDLAVEAALRTRLQELADEAGVRLSVLVRGVLRDFAERVSLDGGDLVDDLDLEQRAQETR